MIIVATAFIVFNVFFSYNSGVVSVELSKSQANNQWYRDGVDLIRTNLKVKENRATAKNAIMFLGDGMGISTVTAARILEGQMRGKTGEENFLSFEKWPWTALSKTYNTDLQTADSAGTAVAYLSGVKTRGGVIGVDETVRRGYCLDITEASKVKSILTFAEEAGMSTGFVTTARATHASPAVLYAYTADRNWEYSTSSAKDNGTSCKDIALQLVEYSEGDGIDVVFAGGRRAFYPNTVPDPEYPDKNGTRSDGRNLINEWLEKNPGAVYLWNKTDFDSLDVNKVKRVMGLFQPSHMQYEVERASDAAGEPSIAEMTETAIKILSKNPKGFFLFVEGGRIDHGHHSSKAVKALTDNVAMAKAVTKAISILDKEETLMVTTADHSHVFSMAGYPRRGNPIFGIVIEPDNTTAIGKDGLPYTTLGYANGPGGLVPGTNRSNLTGVNTADKDFKQQSLVLKSSETHGAEDVGIYATGPGAYLFHGVVEQNYIFHVMDHALCLTPSKQGTCLKHVQRGGKAPTSKPKPPSSAVAMSAWGYLAIFLLLSLSLLIQYISDC